MKRLIIATDAATATLASRNALTAFLEGKDWSVWHWFQDLWLVDGVPDSIDLTALKGEISAALPAPNHNIMIMSTEGSITHSGLVPAASIPWIQEHWNLR